MPLEPHEDLADAIALHAIASAQFEEATRLVATAKAAYDRGEYRPAASALASAVDGALAPLRDYVDQTWQERTAQAAIEAAGLAGE
jgi:electron transfer flavoprotein alpha subunit